MNSSDILIDILDNLNGTKTGVIALNQPRRINALTLSMIQAIQHQLDLWREQDEIVCVILRGEGEKGFCAGGDVKSVREISIAPLPTEQKAHQIQQFFHKEYRLDYDIHTYPKPIIVIAHGITMGGGVGLMAGCRHRIITETSKLAMPEVLIGLYPDVGASWFLNKMPNRLGLFLGLTGITLNAADILFSGLADYCISQHSLQSVFCQIQQIDFQIQSPEINNALVASVLCELEERTAPDLDASQLAKYYHIIQTITKSGDLNDVINRINTWSSHQHAWLDSIHHNIRQACPQSLAVTWSAFHHALHLSLKEVFEFEETLSTQCCLSPDFAEGVRSLLIDKDQTPLWSSSLQDLHASVYPSLLNMLQKHCPRSALT